MRSFAFSAVVLLVGCADLPGKLSEGDWDALVSSVEGGDTATEVAAPSCGECTRDCGGSLDTGWINEPTWCAFNGEQTDPSAFVLSSTATVQQNVTLFGAPWHGKFDLRVAFNVNPAPAGGVFWVVLNEDAVENKQPEGAGFLVERAETLQVRALADGLGGAKSDPIELTAGQTTTVRLTRDCDCWTLEANGVTKTLQAARDLPHEGITLGSFGGTGAYITSVMLTTGCAPNEIPECKMDDCSIDPPADVTHVCNSLGGCGDQFPRPGG